MLVSVFDLLALDGADEGGTDAKTFQNFKVLRVLRVFRLIKLLRLLRMNRIFKRWEAKVAINCASAAALNPPTSAGPSHPCCPARRPCLLTHTP